MSIGAFLPSGWEWLICCQRRWFHHALHDDIVENEHSVLVGNNHGLYAPALMRVDAKAPDFPARNNCFGCEKTFKEFPPHTAQPVQGDGLAANNPARGRWGERAELRNAAQRSSGFIGDHVRSSLNRIAATDNAKIVIAKTTLLVEFR